MTEINSRGFTHESTHNETAEWYTPPEIFEALGVEFDLDPCAAPGGAHVPAERYFTHLDDGLSQPWEGFVWMNPPYGQETPKWLERLAEHGNGIALVFARTDTGWFHGPVASADIICFIKGRIKFMMPDGTRGGTPGSGSMLVGYGPTAVAAITKCGLGMNVVPPKDAYVD